MAKGFGPILLLGGAAALMMMVGKKKKENGVEIPPEIPDEDEEDLTDEERCERFLSEIYVDDVESGELHIIDIAVEQDFIPSLRSIAQDIISSAGAIDPDESAAYMALLALKNVMPFCDWSAMEGELISPDDERAKKIYNGLILLANQIATEEGAVSREATISPGDNESEPGFQQAEFEKED